VARPATRSQKAKRLTGGAGARYFRPVSQPRCPRLRLGPATASRSLPARTGRHLLARPRAAEIARAARPCAPSRRLVSYFTPPPRLASASPRLLLFCSDRLLLLLLLRAPPHSPGKAKKRRRKYPPARHRGRGERTPSPPPPAE
jgi:hypothetical protein